MLFVVIYDSLVFRNKFGFGGKFYLKKVLIEKRDVHYQNF